MSYNFHQLRKLILRDCIHSCTLGMVYFRTFFFQQAIVLKKRKKKLGLHLRYGWHKFSHMKISNNFHKLRSSLHTSTTLTVLIYDITICIIYSPLLSLYKIILDVINLVSNTRDSPILK